MADTERSFGRLDILVNNAAAADGGTVVAMSLEEWNRSIASSLTSVFLCSKYALPAMLRQGQGAIVNISSTNSLVANPGFGAYSAAKAGVNALTRVMALDHARGGVRVNAVCPGYIALPTPRHRPTLAEHLALEDAAALGRAGSVEDVAAAVAFLASDDAKWITGTCLVVDGGLLLQSPAAVLVESRRKAAGRSPEFIADRRD
jgi:meso-butanediol dehydrogenase/(S,S)-butanediol dehydrogenase/diacetyl reductase